MTVKTFPSISSLNWQLPGFSYVNNLNSDYVVSVGFYQTGVYTAGSVTVFLSFDGVNYFQEKTYLNPVFTPPNPSGGTLAITNLAGVKGVRLYPTNLAFFTLLVSENISPQNTVLIGG